MSLDSVFFIIIIIFSVIIHEVSHGYMAYWLGDKTAYYAGRLTLNPLKHIDIMGSIIVPLLLIISKSGFLFGWAKPVPYNSYNLKYPIWGDALVAVAGPLSNTLIAIAGSVALRSVAIYAPAASWAPSVINILIITVLSNVVLALFNLVPIPPLDGSKVLFAFLPLQWRRLQFVLEQYGFFLVLIFILFFWQYVSGIIGIIFFWLTGVRIF